MNTVVLRDVIRRRAEAGRGTMPLLAFAHGTELKMYNNEKRGDNPAEFPLRFLPFMQNEKIFDYADPDARRGRGRGDLAGAGRGARRACSPSSPASG